MGLNFILSLLKKAFELIIIISITIVISSRRMLTSQGLMWPQREKSRRRLASRRGHLSSRLPLRRSLADHSLPFSFGDSDEDSRKLALVVLMLIDDKVNSGGWYCSWQ